MKFPPQQHYFEAENIKKPSTSHEKLQKATMPKSTFLLLIFVILALPVSADILFLRADIVEDGSVRNRQVFIQPSILLSKSSNDIDSQTIIQGSLTFYPSQDRSGCKRNASASLGRSGTNMFVLVTTDDCDLQTKIKNVQDAGAQSILLYNPKNTTETIQPPALSNDEPADMIIAAVDGTTAAWLLSALEFTGSSPVSSNRDVSLIMGVSQEDGPGIWEFTLIIVVVLLGFSFIMSIAMHCHLYRVRRRRMENEQMNSPSSTLEMVRVMKSDDLEELCPILVYGGKNQPLRRLSSASPTPDTSNVREVSLNAGGNDEDETGRDRSHSLDVCAICIEEFDVGCHVRQLPCQHVFHLPCIDMWLTTKNITCPLCKLEIQDKTKTLLMPATSTSTIIYEAPNSPQESVEQSPSWWSRFARRRNSQPNV